MAEFKTISPDAPVGAKLMNWVDNRFPATQLFKDHMSEYYAPKNLNIWYVFGALSLLVLVIQIVTGIFLTMNYKPDAAQAFASVEYIMRDVPYGWLIRYMHSTGASAFFVVVCSDVTTCRCFVSSCSNVSRSVLCFCRRPSSS